MEYWICEDLEGATEVKIHKEECGHETGRDRDAKTMEWHGPYDYDEAKSRAEKLSIKYNKGWKNAGCCIR